MRLIPSPDAICQEIGGETVILDLSGESYIGLDEVATRIWQLLQAGVAPPQIVTQLLLEYDADRTTIEADVDRFIAELLELGLLGTEATP